MNYDMVLEKILEQVKEAKKKPRLLLHCCCAPCSSACIERLFPFFEITLFFYNPNIEEEEEYEKRKQELLKFAKMKKIQVEDTTHEKEAFQKMSVGYEKEKERGKRCFLCYQLRLTKTAQVALEKHFDYFGTTLSISPFKNANWINEIGSSLEKETGIHYLYADFKKKNGYQKSILLSKKYGLYRQDYCGCRFSKEERMAKKNTKLNYSSNTPSN